MLKSVAGRVAEGGQLTYATCSVLREEDEDVVQTFLASPQGADFEVVALPDVPDASDVAAVDAMSKLATPVGFMRTYPAPAVCDGHFCAVLRKKRA